MERDKKREKRQQRSRSQSLHRAIGRRVAETFHIEDEAAFDRVLDELSRFKAVVAKREQLAGAVKGLQEDLGKEKTTSEKLRRQMHDSVSLMEQETAKLMAATFDKDVEIQQLKNQVQQLTGRLDATSSELEATRADREDKVRSANQQIEHLTKRNAKLEAEDEPASKLRTKLQKMADNLRQAEYQLAQAQRQLGGSDRADLLKSITDLEHAVGRHRSFISTLVGALRWCGKTPPMQPGGDNHDGWNAHVAPILAKLDPPKPKNPEEEAA